MLNLIYFSVAAVTFYVLVVCAVRFFLEDEGREPIGGEEGFVIFIGAFLAGLFWPVCLAGYLLFLAGSRFVRFVESQEVAKRGWNR